MIFINREEELKILEREYTNLTASFIVIYGRRRVGKTTLIEKFILNKENIYYLAANEKDTLQIKEFQQTIAEYFDDKVLFNLNFQDWKQFFNYLTKIWPKNKNIVLAIDEVTNIIKNNPSFPSYLQQFWDKFLSKTKTKLILSGSLVGLIIKEVLSHDSPLYGRRSCDIKLNEFNFADAVKFMPGFNIEKQLKFFSLVGGVPKYLLFVKNFSFDEFLEVYFFNKNGYFYREGIFLLSQEFNDPSSYINILKAISKGNTKINEISDFVGVETKKLAAYVDILIKLGLVRKIVPVTENEKKFRGAIYLLKDNFLDFWHEFVHPNRSKIELGKGKQLVRLLKNEINSYVGKKFEYVCKELLISFFPSFTKIGRQWGKFKGEKGKNTYEIDICALNEKTKEILFCECKWKDNVNAEKILAELKEKAEYVGWPNKEQKAERKEYYAIFAKSFKKRVKEKNVFLFDLKDIGKALKAKTGGKS